MRYEFETARVVRRVELPRVGDRSAWEEDEIDQEIFKPDTRAMVKDTTTIPHRFICRLLVRTTDSLKREGHIWGTGFLIGNRHVLTAAHNIIATDGSGKRLNSLEIKVIPGCNHGLTNPLNWTPFGSLTVTGPDCRVPMDYQAAFNKPGYPNAVHRAFDYGLITLREEIGQKKFGSLKGRPLGFWGDVATGGFTFLRETTTAEAAGKSIYVCGYPTDKCKTKQQRTPLVSSDCEPVQRASTQWMSMGKLQPASSDRLIAYTADSFHGMSGGPVWHYDSAGLRHCVGVHRGAGDGLNEAVVITKEVLEQLRKWGWQG